MVNIKTVGFILSQSFLSGLCCFLLVYFNGSVCVFKGKIQIVMVWLESFRVLVESGCMDGILRCAVQDIGLVGGMITIVADAAGKGYQGRFTFYFSDFSVVKCPSVAPTQCALNLISNEHANFLQHKYPNHGVQQTCKYTHDIFNILFFHVQKCI